MTACSLLSEFTDEYNDITHGLFSRYAFVANRRCPRLALVHRGIKTGEELYHEDRAEQPIPPQNIVRIVRLPEQDFINLSGYDAWKPPLA